jgi:hypothetical protein
MTRRCDFAQRTTHIFFGPWRGFGNSGFLQIALALLHRHHAMSLVPHLAAAMLVAGTVLLLSLFVLTQQAKHDQLKRLAVPVVFLAAWASDAGVFTDMGEVS